MNKSSILPYDVYERHKKVGSLIGNAETVLDVGGQLNMLSHFCNAQNLTVANVSGSEEKSDLIIKGDRLPFEANSFQIVCSIDVFEHIPRPKRQAFIEDLLRVASQKVIMSFPIGTPKHIEYEKNLQKRLLEKGLDVTYLNEHIKFGLPTLEEVKKLTDGIKTKKFYSGNLSINNVLFSIFIFDPKIKYVRNIVYFLKLAFNLISNPLIYPVLTNRGYSNEINRIYLVINK